MATAVLHVVKQGVQEVVVVQLVKVAAEARKAPARAQASQHARGLAASLAPNLLQLCARPRLRCRRRLRRGLLKLPGRRCRGWDRRWAPRACQLLACGQHLTGRDKAAEGHARAVGREELCGRGGHQHGRCGAGRQVGPGTGRHRRRRALRRVGGAACCRRAQSHWEADAQRNAAAGQCGHGRRGMRLLLLLRLGLLQLLRLLGLLSSSGLVVVAVRQQVDDLRLGLFALLRGRGPGWGGTGALSTMPERGSTERTWAAAGT